MYINNDFHSDNADNSLIPKSFRFAIYASANKTETVLSLFIQTDDTQYGKIEALQADWIAQWDEKYKVTPIASPYTTSVIFNNRIIISFMDKSVQEMTIQPSPDQPTGGGLKLTVLTGEFYYIAGMRNTELYHQEARHDFYLSLYDGSNALHITLCQNVGLYVIYSGIGILINEPKGNPNSAPIALFHWCFSCDTEWYEWAHPVSSHFGVVVIANKLEKKVSVDDNDLSNYLLHFDIGIDQSDWDKPDIQADRPEWWEAYGGVTGWKPSLATDALPSLPSAKVELINFKFFMTTNLLLPGNKVINFEKSPGARFPKDLYVVGHVTKK